ncbi:tRNA 2-selenouridine(34) synthase MnmH [Ramlibacter rhizophilus]|uniref:tRNA 2-selenouridine(34) synthase MnmH n=1 Tax=Ramlibacter rhizophilus TaxID=1781167 RepID=A0A4Z0BXG7_9BURK|nr:tRNA 2-selenouridine(34) synthase MnmH [Ramlibacter rhizophilus]TFZ03204.1 tRNA 2-selenouridine(34) synthase MnmH [Ramlibacter rhizophilus]
MSLVRITAAEAMQRLGEFDTLIDARSQAEYEEDRLPGAVNWPSLDDAQRHRIGTLYKQVSPFEAKKQGAALVAANIARHIEREVLDKPKGWQPLVYCWRGGKRSGALALVLDQIGFRVHWLDGGYKAFRTQLLAQLPALAQCLSYRVVCGPTGSGKTRLLQALAEAGAQVLDLEALAQHRSSVLGLAPGETQPSQKQFDTRIWERLRGFDPARVVWVESESKKVGNVAVPEALISAMRASPCFHLALRDEERVALLLEDYDWFVKDPEHFCSRLDALAELRGRGVVREWQDRVRAGFTSQVVQELLVQHYDPMYAASIRRNFAQWESARTVEAASRAPSAMRDLARVLIEA